jgi:predicted transposase/invertase (TIGR01784 family)
MNYIQFEDDDDIIEICQDNVFKTIFTGDDPRSQGALKKLISAYIGREVEILAVTANEPPLSDTRDRQIRYDIRVKFNQGELANVEMSLHPKNFETLRLEYYIARLYSSQEIQGTDKTYKDLTQTYQIAIIGRNHLYEDRELVHHFEYYDAELGVRLGGRTKIIVVELEKVAAITGKPISEMSGEEMWALFFQFAKERKRRTLVNEVLRKEEGIAMAAEMLLRISREEAERARLESEYKYALDYQSEMVTARREGRAEVARNLKIMGLSPEQIRTATGLSLAEIERL